LFGGSGAAALKMLLTDNGLYDKLLKLRTISLIGEQSSFSYIFAEI
jgi:hypothetical protein